VEKVKILGISGSPRHGNTEIGVKEALAGAAELPDVETEFYTMAGKRINPCSCRTHMRCSAEGTVDNPCPTWGADDAITILYKKMLNFDGFIVGTPVYVGGVSAQMKSLWDRLSNICYNIPPEMGLRNKPVGAIASGDYRNGGLEAALLDIWKIVSLLDLLPIPSGPDFEKKCCPWGGALTHYWQTQQDWHELYAYGSTEELAYVKEDEYGMYSCRNTGRRVAEITRILKAGFAAVPREATYWPAGSTGGIAEADWKL